MRVVLLAILALLVLGGGATGAYFYFNGTSAEAAATQGEHEKAHESNKKHADDSHVEFIELDPLILPIVDGSGVTQVVSLVVVLEVPDHEAALKVEKFKPRLKDAFIQDLYGTLHRSASKGEELLPVSNVRARLNKASVRVLGEDTVNGVLLQVVQQRKI